MNVVAEKPQSIQPDDKASGVTMAHRRGLVRRLLRPAILLVVIGAALVTGGWWFTEGRYIESTDNAYVQGDITVLSPRIDGNISSILVEDNQYVRPATR